MNTLHQTFERQAGNAGTPDLDIEQLVGLGERRLRRRRLTAVAGTGAAVALAIAVAVGGTAVMRADQQQGPIDRPPTNPDRTHTTTPTQTRPIVYSDVRLDHGPDFLLGDPIHVGDHVVETGSGWVHMDVTDDGVVYSTGGYVDDGRLWFTDGGTPEQIGSHACVQLHGWPGTVVTGDSGSLAAWFDCTQNHHAELVVYDTSAGRETMRREIPGCSETHFGRDLGHEVRIGACLPGEIIGDHLYIPGNESYGTNADTVQNYALEFDLATDRVSKVKLVIPYGEDLVAQSYLDDIGSQRRSLVIGDSWETGTPTLGGDFGVVGKRLVPSSDDGSLTSAFDTATHRPIRLNLPPDYQPSEYDEFPGGIDFVIFEWLDDDTVALVRPTVTMAPDLPDGTSLPDRDILTCRLSTGRCELAVPSHGYLRVLPGAALW
jgi:hypothetical protein